MGKLSKRKSILYALKISMPRGEKEMVISDNRLIGNQSYLNGNTAIVEKRTEQVRASVESTVSEKWASRSNTNDIAVIYEKSNPSNLKMVTYAKPSTVNAMALSKSSIKAVQTKLNAIGYSCGTPDGIAGKNTKAAVKSFQKLCGLKNQSGNITNETITKLNSVYNRSRKGVLSRGLRNNASVKKLQQNLNRLNFNCGTPDGTFGAGTETALKNFQKANNLTIDGVAGSATLNAINKKVAKLNKPKSNPNSGQYNTVTKEGIAYSKSKEGLSLKPYNNGKTIGYGMDIANFPDIKINYKKDGSITKQEADRLFEIVYKRFADKVNNYLDSKNIKLDQYSYAAAVDLVYNRGMNDMTKEVINAMGSNNTKKVKSLLSNFDYRYAKKYLYKKKANPDAEAKAYVKRNPGLKIRRNEEFIMFSEKRFLV